jgi:hypothetical protein
VDRNCPTRKLTSRYLGPYIVSAVISTTAYKLELPSTLKIHPVFHVSMIKPYKESDEFLRATPPAPITLSDNSEKFEVDIILDKRFLRNKVQYLVKWIGYPLYDATWEPVGNLKNAKEKVKEFESMRSSNS